MLGATVLGTSAALWPVGAARADSVEDATGVVSGITIVALEDDLLVFLYNDGRAVQRPAASLVRVSVSPGNDRAADELTRAEALRLRDKRREAIALYRRTESLTGKDWVRDYALMRLVTLYDEVGDLYAAYQAFCRLAVSHPRMCERIQPRRIPRGDSEACRRVLADIRDQLARPQPEALIAALERMRSAILRPRAAGGTTTAPGGDSSELERVRAVWAEGAEAARRSDYPGVSAAVERLERMRGPYAGLASDLLRAAEALQRGDARRAGVIAVRVHAARPDGEWAPQALFLAAESQVRLAREAAAADLFRQCAGHARVSDELRGEAEARLAALSKPGGSTTAGDAP